MRVIGKILSVIIVGILSVILFAMDQVAKVYSFISSWILLFCGIFFLLAICTKRWDAMLLFSGIVVSIFVGFVVIAFAMILTERVREKIKCEISL